MPSVMSMTVVGSVPHQPPVNHQIDAVFEAVADFVRVGQRLVVFGQHQGATEQRLAQFLQQAQGDGVVGNAQADGLRFGCSVRLGTSLVACRMKV